MSTGSLRASEPGRAAERDAAARRPATWAIVVAVTLAAAVPYVPVLRHGLVWDDPALVERVVQAHDRGGLAGVASAEFRMDPREATGYYRPVVLLSLWADHALGHGAAVAFHGTNLLLHLACSLLVAVLATALLASRSAGLGAGLLFAVHPVHVESVAWVAGRTDLWATMFVLVATLAWVRGRVAAGRSRALLVAASGVALAAALLSKENAIALPAVLAAWEALLPARGSGPDHLSHAAAKPWSRRVAPWLGAWGIGVTIAVAARVASGLGAVASRATAPLATLQADPALVPQILVKALGLLAVPWPLNAFWTRSQLAWGTPAIACAVTAALLLWLAARWGDWRVAGAGVVWALGFLVPVLGFAPRGASPFAERFLYLPSVGFCLAIAAVVPALTRSSRARAASWTVVTALAIVLGAVSLSRTRVWRDEVSLFESIVHAGTDSADIWDNLGQAYLEARRPAEAERAFRESLRLDPNRGNAWNGLGTLWGRAGRLDEAARAFESAIRLDPSAPHARFNLAMLCLASGDRACAETQRRALESLAPDAAARLSRVMMAPAR